MKMGLKLAGSAALLVFAMTGANAQMFMQQGEGEQRVIMSATERDSPPLSVMDAGADGARPADCPEGSYFLSVDANDDTRQIVTNCATNESFLLADPMTMDPRPDFEFPEGAMMLQPMDDEQVIESVTEQDDLNKAQ